MKEILGKMKMPSFMPDEAQSERVRDILLWVETAHEGLLSEQDVEAIDRVLYLLGPGHEDYESDPLTDGGGPGSWEAGRVDYTGEQGEPASSLKVK